MSVTTKVQFSDVAAAVNTRLMVLFERQELYVVDCDRDALWDNYLNSFPEGTNPIFRERREHECSTCRHFVKNLGHVVAIDSDGNIETVWDVEAPEHYQAVVNSMAEFVRAHAIRTIFRVKHLRYGERVTTESKPGHAPIDWYHFYGVVPSKFYHSEPQEAAARRREETNLFLRGLRELKPSALDNVAELIQDNMLYRGQEHKRAVKGFQGLQRLFNSRPDHVAEETFAWMHCNSPYRRFRNTVIGTLVQDLSEGKDLEKAVKLFESKVAPANYKRPKSLITPRMIEDAMKTVRELDLESALERRYAKLSDVSVNNVLFVDRNVQGRMRDGVDVTALLMEEAKVEAPSFDGATEVTPDEFLADILPNSKSIELLVSSDLMNRFVSVTAPTHSTAGRLMRWDNDFAWSYDGNVTDSIKARVKAAGGKIDALLRVSLSWFNTDDLDLHLEGPLGHVYYGNKRGILDVDMNAGGGYTTTPVENMAFDRLPDGQYQFSVHQFAKRNSTNVGFEVEYEYDGNTVTYSYDKMLANGSRVPVVDLKVRNGVVVEVTPKKGITSSSRSMEHWGVKTNQLVPVNTVMLSPNHWDDQQVGNRHLFFILQDCLNPEKTRGLYNEFLSPELEKHRKVFEILGDKLKCPESTEQLSGIGFSWTQRGEAKVMVQKGNKKRPYCIKF